MAQGLGGETGVENGPRPTAKGGTGRGMKRMPTIQLPAAEPPPPDQPAHALQDEVSRESRHTRIETTAVMPAESQSRSGPLKGKHKEKSSQEGDKDTNVNRVGSGPGESVQSSREGTAGAGPASLVVSGVCLGG
jgi:hypothetical protein